MRIIVSKHAKERIQQRLGKGFVAQTLAEDAWKNGRIPNWGASKFLFWKWANNDNEMCDVRKYMGYFYFFYPDGDKAILKTLYKDVGPKKKEEQKPQKEKDPNYFLISRGLMKPKKKKRR